MLLFYFTENQQKNNTGFIKNNNSTVKMSLTAQKFVTKTVPVFKKQAAMSQEPPECHAELRFELSPEKTTMIDKNNEKYNIPPEFLRNPPAPFKMLVTDEGLNVKLFNPFISELSNLNLKLSHQNEIFGSEIMGSILNEFDDEVYDNLQRFIEEEKNTEEEENPEEDQVKNSHEEEQSDVENYVPPESSQPSTLKGEESVFEKCLTSLRKEKDKNSKVLEQLDNKDGKFHFMYIYKFILYLIYIDRFFLRHGNVDHPE